MDCHIGDMGILRKVIIREGQLEKWKHGVFGKFLGIRGDQLFSGKSYHSLLHRKIEYPIDMDDEIWFNVGGDRVRFGKDEFLLCTGLKFWPPTRWTSVLI
ncbi:hypothetical protein ACOSQ3_013293 [Xanthoceras sorbifolium]